MLPGKKYKPEDFFDIARRRWWVVLVPAAVGLVAAFVVGRMLPNIYRSETLILVVPQRVPESYVRSTVSARIEDRLTTISQQILSRPKLERIIGDFGLYRELRQRAVMEDVVEKMRQDIDVKLERGDAFRVSYVSNDAVLAQKVTKQLASLFIDENLRDREVLAEGTNDFLDSQLDDARRRLVDHERKLEEYRRQYSGQLPSQVDVNLTVIQNLQLQLQTLTESMNRDRERRLVIERQLADMESPTGKSVSSQIEGAEGMSLAKQLEVTRARLAELETRLKPEHPDVIQAKRVIRDLERQAADPSRASVEGSGARPTLDPAELTRQNRSRELRGEIANIDAQLQIKQDDEKRLRSSVAGYQAKVDAAPTRESELIELTRDYETLQNTYKSLLAKREESKMAASLERRQIGQQFKVLDPAQVPERPFSPNRLRLLMLGAFLGFGLGVALVALVEYRDTTLRTADDVVQALNLPVIVTLPYIAPTGKRGWLHL